MVTAVPNNLKFVDISTTDYTFRGSTRCATAVYFAIHILCPACHLLIRFAKRFRPYFVWDFEIHRIAMYGMTSLNFKFPFLIEPRVLVSVHVHQVKLEI